MMESGVGVVNVGNIVPWCIFVVVYYHLSPLGFALSWGTVLLLWGVIFGVGCF